MENLNPKTENTYLIGVLCGVSVDKIVRGVQSTLEKPGNVAMFKTTRRNSFKITVPSEQLASEITKKLIGVLNRLLVEFFVVLEAVNVRLSGMLTKNIC